MEAKLQVYETRDYDNFHFIKGNRNINRSHVERLKESFAEEYLPSPIIVNEEGGIIDGQHRYIAAKELELAILFIVVNGFGLKEVQIYNMNSINWSKIDFLNMYCDLEYEPYIKFRGFMEDYPEFGIRACETLLTGKTGYNTEFKAGKKMDVRYFEEGNLEIYDMEEARKNADKLRLVKDHYKGYYRTVFVKAMTQIFKKEEYEHDKFIKRLESNPNSLYHCNKVNDYKFLVEQIYNFRSHNPVNLRI